MSDTLPIPPPGFDELDTDAKIDYIQSLWDRILEQPDDIPTPARHLQTIRERLASQQTSPDDGQSWEEVRSQVESRLRQDRA